ncbi:hypothetical protein OY671_007622 [Metschnikowia pulcherrima]|nr:hypothetical protein OY671_007622 [Metschnikowia pulcherrima]
MLLGGFQPRSDQIHIGSRRGLASLGFLSEGVQDIDRLREFDRIDRAERIALVVVYDLDHASAAKALQRLSAGVSPALSRKVQGIAHYVSHIVRELPKIAL